MKIDYKGASTCGLAVGLFDVVLSLIVMYPLREAMMSGSAFLSVLFAVLRFGAFFAVLYYYKKHYSTDAFTYGNGIKVGLAIGLFYAIILAAMQFCVYTFDVQYVEELKELTKQTIAMSGMPADQAQMALQSTSFVFSPWYIGFSALLGSIIGALFYSLISMIFLKESADYESVMKEVDEDEE